VRRDRDELQDPLDVTWVETRLAQALGSPAANESLGARTGVDAGRLDADDAARAVARGRSDADQRDHLLRREAVGIPRRDAHLGHQRLLAGHDRARDVLGEILDEERIVVDDALDRLLEQLGEAGHVDTFLPRIEVDGAVDRRGDQLLALAAPDPDCLLHAGDACAGEADRHVGGGGLEVGRQARRLGHTG